METPHGETTTGSCLGCSLIDTINRAAAEGASRAAVLAALTVALAQAVAAYALPGQALVLADEIAASLRATVAGGQPPGHGPHSKETYDA